MRISANEIKSGNILDYESDLWIVTKQPEHTKPGKGGAYVQVEMKSLRKGNKLNQRFSSSKNIEKAFLEKKEMQFLYKEENFLVFMDLNSFEQVTIDSELVKEKLLFFSDGMIVEIEFYQEQALNVILAKTIIAEIKETSPVIKGSAVSSSYKPALMVNGLRIMVPTYLKTGEKVIIKTADTTFIKRAE